MQMKFEGVVKVLIAPEAVNETLEKVTVVLEETGDGQYKESLAIDFLKTEKKDGIALLEGISEGDIVSINFNTRANESNSQPGKFFNSISGWKLDVIGKAPAAQLVEA